ncbi:MFS transporter [Streptomyces bobili]|uniref:MFS transporter n=1 Tax=Streptomyces bobili TaxID=67280 RepID=UPI00343E2A3E
MVSAQILINAYVGKSYPAANRAGALGWTLGLGRVGTVVGPTLIGWIVGSQDGRLAFTVFAVAAVAAALLLSWESPETETRPVLRSGQLGTAHADLSQSPGPLPAWGGELPKTRLQRVNSVWRIEQGSC